MSSISSWKPPDKKPRSLKRMREYLSEHPRYCTMNSWNQSTSYARGIKLRWLDFPDKQTEETAWDLIGSDTDWWSDSGARGELNEFDERWNHAWQISANGRSGGYLVLYQGGVKPSQYRSRCTACGQQNCCSVALPPTADATQEEKLRAYWLTHSSWVPSVYPSQPDVAALGLEPDRVMQIVRELQAQHRGADGRVHVQVTLHNVCGRCHQPARINYAKPPVEIFAYPGKGTDEDQDYDEWDRVDLQSRVDLVWDFDQTVDAAVARFIDYCGSVHVEEEEILVPRTIRLAQPNEA